MPQRHDLPSTYYRVSLKALIFDAHKRLLVFKDKNGECEMPGGGFEHNENVEDCLRRELKEEIGADVNSVGQPEFVYVYHKPPGYYKLSIVFRVTIQVGDLLPLGDDLTDFNYVDKQTFLELPFQTSEQAITKHANRIWPSQKV